MQDYTPIYIATVALLVLELLLGRHRGIYDRHTILVTAACAVGSLGSRPLAALLIAAVAGFLLPHYSGALSGTPLYISFPIVFFLTEFCFYWAHRWAHEAKGKRNQWLWKLHRAHHSGKFMNVGLTIRLNAFWSFVVPTSWILGTATYLGMSDAAAATLMLIYCWNLITHSHFRWDDPLRRHRIVGPLFRALEHVLVSPGIHHTHHGYGRDGGNYRNYAVTLSVIDWAFGTLHIPEGRPWRYGIPGPNAHWAEEAFYPLVRMPARPARTAQRQ